MKNMKKSVAILLAVVLLVGVVIGGTLAWFTDKTQKVKNTFTVGNIDIELKETDSDDEDTNANENSYKMIPGWTIDKDPTAKVLSGSEYAYLFVKIDKSDSVDSYLDYKIDTAWTALDGVAGVYYIEIDTAEEINKAFTILAAGEATYDEVKYTWSDNQVLVKPTVTKVMMDNIEEGKTVAPTLDFTAFAVQLYKNNTTKFTPAEAWAIANT